MLPRVLLYTLTHRGTVPVNSDNVVELYGGTHVPIYIMDDHHHRYGLEMQPKLLQFLDSFSLAEMSLLVDVSDVRSKPFTLQITCFVQFIVPLVKTNTI